MPHKDARFKPTAANCEAAWLPLTQAVQTGQPIDPWQREALDLRDIVMQMTDFFTQTRWNQFATGMMDEQEGRTAFAAGQAALELMGLKPIGKNSRITVSDKRPLPLAIARFAGRQWIGVDWELFPPIDAIKFELDARATKREVGSLQVDSTRVSDGLYLWLGCWNQTKYHLNVLLAANLGRPELPDEE